MSTPPPETDGDTTSALDQAKTDARDSVAGIGRSVATGAAAGGLAGAAVGAVKGVGVAAVKTKTGRRVLTAIALVPVIGLASLVSIFSGGSDPANARAANAALTVQAASSDISDPLRLEAARNAAVGAGTSWELVAAIAQHESNRGGSKGAGPYGIDLESAGITEDEANDLGRSSAFIANALAEEFEKAGGHLVNPALDTGAVDEHNDDGTRSRVAGEREELVEAQKAVKDAYITALRELPIRSMPKSAETVYALAYTWSLGMEASCPTGDAPVLGGETSVDLNESQQGYAQTIINRVADRGMPKKAAIIALATAMQESTLRMWWNVKVPGSEELTDDKAAIGSDGYSVGLFQQQVNGNEYSWGTVKDAMDPKKSTDMFLDRLLTIDGWETMPIAQAAQAVQVSAYPEEYAKWEDMVTTLVEDLKPTGDGSYGSDTGSTDDKEESPEEDGNHEDEDDHKDEISVNPCGTTGGKAWDGDLGDGEWTNPLPNGVFTSGFGHRNVPGLPAWAQNHVGIDLATPGSGFSDGGPVIAPTDIRITGFNHPDGCVIAKENGDDPDFGFAFCHLNSYDVKVGDELERGDIVGIEGNKASLGVVITHLHFEIYEPEAPDVVYPYEGWNLDPEPILKEKGAWVD